MATSDKLKFTYFPLFAKGPASVLALEHSGVEWEGANPSDWKTEKQQTPWNTLPTLDVPGFGLVGHEASILNYIATLSPKVGGETLKDRLVSDQVLHEAEDIYDALGRNVNTVFKKEQYTAEHVENFFTNDDSQRHNKQQGVRVYLKLLEDFYNQQSPSAGFFTTSGVTVGECKLFATFHMLKQLRNDVFADYPGLAAFYDRFGADEKTAAVLQTGAKMPTPFNPYWVGV